MLRNGWVSTMQIKRAKRLTQGYREQLLSCEANCDEHPHRTDDSHGIRKTIPVLIVLGLKLPLKAVKPP